MGLLERERRCLLFVPRSIRTRARTRTRTPASTPTPTLTPMPTPTSPSPENIHQSLKRTLNPPPSLRTSKILAAYSPPKRSSLPLKHPHSISTHQPSPHTLSHTGPSNNPHTLNTNSPTPPHPTQKPGATRDCEGLPSSSPVGVMYSGTF